MSSQAACYIPSDGVSFPVIVCGIMGTEAAILVYLVSMAYVNSGLSHDRNQAAGGQRPGSITSSTAASMLSILSDSLFSSGKNLGDRTMTFEASSRALVVGDFGEKCRKVTNYAK